MAKKAPRYLREIYHAGTYKIVPIGKRNVWQQSCTTLPDSLDEARELIRNGPNSDGDSFKRGPGDDFILNNPVELKYYHNGVKVAHLK